MSCAASATQWHASALPPQVALLSLGTGLGLECTLSATRMCSYDIAAQLKPVFTLHATPGKAVKACKKPADGPEAARTLRLAIVHAILARQRLNERLQRAVPRRIVAAADRALHLEPRRVCRVLVFKVPRDAQGLRSQLPSLPMGMSLSQQH